MGGLTSLLLLLLCVGVTASTVLDLQKRIIGGTPCKSKERGYHVKLVSGTDKLRCGGSLLKNDWILTAAHCWEWGMQAVVGVHPGTKQNIVLIKAPPVMYRDDKNRIHDIMLLKLPSLDNPHQITPVDLPVDCEKQKPKLGDTVQIAGYAATTKGPNNKRGCNEAMELQCAPIKLSDCKKLKSALIKYKVENELRSYDHWLCGDTSIVDTCPGDSGGGVVVGTMIYGVHSFTGDAVYANKEDAGFMDVCEYKKWIEDITKS